jgi:H+-transporting ATPase
MPLQGEGPFINGAENRQIDYGEVVRQSLDMSRPVDNRGGRARGSLDGARTSGENKRSSENKRMSSEVARASQEGKAVRRMSQDVARVSVQRLKDVAEELGQRAADDLKKANDIAMAEQAKTKGGCPGGPDEEHEKKEAVDFVQAPHEGLTSKRAAELMEQWGKNELPEKTTPAWLIFCKLLIGPMPIVLWICALIEAIIENWPDFVILLVIQFVNAGISFYETMKAGDAVAALKNSLKPTATCKRDGKWSDIDATLLVPGDLVLLAAGSAVPADSYVNEGLIEVDQSAMTGESLPVKFRRGDVCKLGSTVVRGETEGTVESTGAHTFFGKTAQMLQASGQAVSSLQILLLRIMIILVTLSLSLCTIALIYLIVEGRKANGERVSRLCGEEPAGTSVVKILESYKDCKEFYEHPDYEIIKHSLAFAVCVLVASVPLAIEIVTTTTLAMGAKVLSGKGAIVTRLAAIEEMAGMDMLCSDKTGTLTLNKVHESCLDLLSSRHSLRSPCSVPFIRLSWEADTCYVVVCGRW